MFEYATCHVYPMHVYARGLETAQAVTPFFNMRCIGSLGWGGVGWGGVGMLTFDALAHMFDATQEHRLREMLTFFEYVHTRSPRN